MFNGALAANAVSSFRYNNYNPQLLITDLLLVVLSSTGRNKLRPSVTHTIMRQNCTVLH